MGKPRTLLELLCEHALTLGADSVSVEYKDGHQWVFAQKGGTGFGIASYRRGSSDAKELLGDLYKAAKRPRPAIFNGTCRILTVRIFDSFGEDAFAVSFDAAPKPDPARPPSFTPKQGQYLAFIHYYSKIHRQAPSESEIQSYFQVSPPAVHEMLKTLQLKGLIERSPGVARSTRLVIRTEDLPALE